MLTLGNIVLLSQLHPVWDWDQNLRAANFPAFGMVDCAFACWCSGLPPVLQPCVHMVWSWAAQGREGLITQALGLSMDTGCETQGAASMLLWIQAEFLEGPEGLRGTWGGAVLEIQGLGHWPQGSWWHSGAMCFSSIRKTRKSNNGEDKIFVHPRISRVVHWGQSAPCSQHLILDSLAAAEGAV